MTTYYQEITMQLKIDNITIDVPKNKEQEVKEFVINLIGGVLFNNQSLRVILKEKS